MTGLDLATIDRLTNGRLGTQDVHVPLRALWGERLRP